MKKLIIAALLFITTATLSRAQGVKEIPLYPDGVPNSKPTPANYVESNAKGWAKNVSVPTLLPYPADKEKATGTAVIICPGGGYTQLSMDNEGTNIARAFNQIGVSAFVLKYRLPTDLIMVDKAVGPLQDAQAAVRLLRSHATDWGINPDKIGMIGFSAGGHLTATAETHFDKAVIANKANISLRPDFAVLLYPRITYDDVTLRGSKQILLGENPSQALVNMYSNEKHVTANTPPTLIIAAQNDATVPIQNSLLFYDILSKAKVKAELHVFQAGGHGFGLNNPTSKSHWFDWCRDWMNANGFLTK
jgi:acetyl esterase/lipase